MMRPLRKNGSNWMQSVAGDGCTALPGSVWGEAQEKASRGRGEPSATGNNMWQGDSSGVGNHMRKHPAEEWQPAVCWQYNAGAGQHASSLMHVEPVTVTTPRPTAPGWRRRKGGCPDGYIGDTEQLAVRGADCVIFEIHYTCT